MTKQTLYRKAIVKRINPDHIAKFGEQAFDGLYKLEQTTDIAIVLHFAGKMAEEGYTAADYSIELTTVKIDPATGKALAA
jgi:hypothetical protein